MDKGREEKEEQVKGDIMSSSYEWEIYRKRKGEFIRKRAGDFSQGGVT